MFRQRAAFSSTARTVIRSPLRQMMLDILRRPFLADMLCRVARSKLSQRLVNDWSYANLQSYTRPQLCIVFILITLAQPEIRGPLTS